MTDEEITKKLRQKDIAVFDYIMAEYNKLLWVVVGNILEKVGSSEDIEDCISDVYVKLLNNPQLYDHKKGSLKSFLVRISKNLAIDRYRKLTRSAVHLFDDGQGQGVHAQEDILEDMLAKENREQILDAIDKLKEPDREIIVRRYFYNEKVRVISEKMCLKSKEIENKLYQGKLKLKSMLVDKEVL